MKKAASPPVAERIGLPVARVTRVRETGSPFLEITARPIVDVVRLRAVLLIPRSGPVPDQEQP